MLFSPKRFGLPFSIGLALVGIMVVWFGARSMASATDSPLDVPDAGLGEAVPAEARLHNPHFDNGIWYEFEDRYDMGYPPGNWLPAGDTFGDPQDWRLWFLDGTDLVEADPTKSVVHTAPECVQMRNYHAPGVSRQVAGLYHVVQDATPCLVYQFEMYGLSRQKESDDYLSDMKVGIEPTGWDLQKESYAPAVHNWPSTMVWGPSQLHTTNFGPLAVSAEALANQITVVSFADASGGNSHKIHWDTASLMDVTPARIADPGSLPPPSIIDANANPGTTSATVTWTTGNPALGQVYYRPASAPDTPPILTYTVFLPITIGGSSTDWLVTPLNKTATTSHNAFLINLAPGQTYEYIVVSRGLSGDQCVTWVSAELTFKTTE
jgi:hypothetical protein